MKKINKIAIVWESDTGGGVNSYLRYLLHSKVFLEKEITIFTNFENQGAKPLMKDLAKLKNIKFIFFKSFFDGERKNLLEKIIFYFLNPVFLLLTVFKFKKILSNSNFDVLLCECGNYGIFRSEQAAILASKNLYGGSITQFSHSFKRFGWKVDFVDAKLFYRYGYLYLLYQGLKLKMI